MRRLQIALFVIYFLISGSVVNARTEVITASNIASLKSVLTIEFADLQSMHIENGWFALSPDGEYMATMSRDNQIVVWNASGQVIDSYAIQTEDDLTATVLDAAFNTEHGLLTSAHAAGDAFYVVYRYPEAQFMEYYRFESNDVPLRIWRGEDTLRAWLEVAPYDSSKTRYVLRLNPLPLDRIRLNEVPNTDELAELPSGPENDPDSFLRIGRIDPPYAITVTQDFLVKRWNLETGEVTASAQVDALPGAGHLTPNGRYFVWRDGESQGLHLLDFETGKDQTVAPLAGTYIPFLLLDITGSVIIGVDVGSAPVVTVWDVATGQHRDLDQYRDCNRQPDMARLSLDGTTLVIGCDAGLDIWRVVS